MSERGLFWLERGLWGAAMMCVLAIGITIWRSRPPKRTVVPSIPVTTDDVAMYDRGVLMHMADSAIANDVFRSDRRPTHVAFGTTPSPSATVVAPPRPHLTVAGIIGGPPWRAVLNGVPNYDGGAVIGPGDTVGGLRVRSIRHDTVIVQGADTTWRLTVEH